ncbi:MAG: SMC-Scp complex subunit ScpB [bacterium]|nr:SMC-Scp complex subunit ScpB [bacterium]
MNRPQTTQIVEALLFSSRQGLSVPEIAKLLELEKSEVRGHLARLQEEYNQQGRAFELVEVGGGFLLRTRMAYKEWVLQSKSVRQVRLSPGLMETLAIIAYKQPVTRAAIEEIRGVDSSYAVKSLLERDLLRITGKLDAPGRPMLFGTSRRFLEAFGLKDLKDLPRPEEYDLSEHRQVSPESLEAEAEAETWAAPEAANQDLNPEPPQQDER